MRRIDKCVTCGMMNTIVVKNMCSKCYQKYWRDKKYPKKEKMKNCLDCDIDLTLPKRVVKNLCIKCYDRRIKLSKKKPCKNCGNILTIGTSSGLCNSCKKVIEPGRFSEVYAKKRIKDINNIIIDKNQMIEIKLMFIKFKRGLWSDADVYRLVNIHLDTIGFKNELETLTPENQIIAILRDLKELYDIWKDRLFV